MTVYEGARIVARMACWAAIKDAAKVALSEEGACGVLKLTANLTHGEVIQGAIAARLEKEAAKILSA